MEFAGVNVIGQKTLVYIQDKRNKKGRWIPVGNESDGLTVLNYDPAREQIMIRSGGQDKVLVMRKSTSVGNGSMAMAPAPTPAFVAPAPVAPPPVVTAPAAPAPDQPSAPAEAAKPADNKPTTVARQEEEARMLVSDLLEIGMAQRKAYEEAQKKAAGVGTTAVANPQPAQAQTTPPN